MKNLILYIILLEFGIANSQNVLPVEDIYLYTGLHEGDPFRDFEDDGITEIRDVNNVFAPFLGLWTYTEQTNEKSIRYTLKVVKGEGDYAGIPQDVLNVKYSIEEKQVGATNWTKIINTLDLPVPNDLSYMYGLDMQKNGDYSLYYFGNKIGDNTCRSKGYILLSPPTTSRPTLRFGFAPVGFNASGDRCTGVFEHVLPSSRVFFLPKIVSK